MESEIWKPVNGYEGLYEVSNFGNVMSLNYKMTGKEKELKQLNNYGYKFVILSTRDKKLAKAYIHKLVAEAFIPNPDNLPEVDHIIPISCGGTNEATNLRWCTHKENMNNKLTKKKMSESQKGERNPMYNKNHSVEAKQKIAEKAKGKKQSKETIEKRVKKISKKVYQYTLDNQLVKVWESAREAGRNGFDSPTIINCCNNKKNTKTHKGYNWSYEPL